MKSDSFDGLVKTRRSFLRTTMFGAATSWTVPVFVQNTFSTLHAAAADSATQAVTGKDAPILVLVQLGGGNDGLNTVIPYTDDSYHKARRTLAYKAADVLKLNDSTGLHPSLPFFEESFKDGGLSIIQGVGYPNPNRSHFRSTEIWTRATDANKVGTTGWVGRYFDNACAGEDPTVGIALVDRQPDAFVASKRPGIALKAPELYRWMQGRSDADEAGEVFRELNSPDAEMGSAGGSIDMVAGGNGGPTLGSAQDALSFLERTGLDAQLSSDKVRELLRKSKVRAGYPGEALGQSLQLVARMIEGGLPTRVYYVSHGGFDTHTGQANAHAQRLKQLNDALAAFMKDLEAQGARDRVMVMTFSEFGRRVQENANGGTDHGAAAPLFVFGPKVKAGIIGAQPSLTDLDNGDLKFHTDFRSVYATVLENWLKTDSKPVLGREFKNLGFV